MRFPIVEQIMSLHVILTQVVKKKQQTSGQRLRENISVNNNNNNNNNNNSKLYCDFPLFNKSSEFTCNSDSSS